MIHCRSNSTIAGLLAAGLFAAPMAPAATLVDFQLNEGTNSVTTTSRVNGLVGTLGTPEVLENEPVSTADSPSQGASDKSVTLNGQGFLVVDDSVLPVLNLATNAFTMEAWIKPDLNDFRPLEGIMGYGNSVKLGLMNSGELVFTLFGVVDINSGMYVLPYGDWHHVAAVWEPGVGVTFYLDGNPAFITETRMPRTPSNSYLTVGGENLNNAFMGSLDRMRVHIAALTQEQLDSVAAFPKGPLASTAVAYNFSENAAPFQSAAPTARPAVSSVKFMSQRSRPQWITDTPSGAASDYALNLTAGTFVVAPDTANAISLNAEDPDFTLEAWVKFGAQPQARSVVYGYNGPGAAFSLSITSDRKIAVTTYGKADTLSQAPIPDDGLWHQIAVVHENGVELRFYVDGVLADTIPYTAGVLVGERINIDFTIGGDPGGLSNPYRGSVDRIRISNEALRPDQLDYLATPGVNPNAPTLSIASVFEISWPTVPAGYKLQSTFDLNDASSWTFVTNAPSAGGGKYYLYVPSTGQRAFYRLVKP